MVKLNAGRSTCFRPAPLGWRSNLAPGRLGRAIGFAGDFGEASAGGAVHGPDLRLSRSLAGEGELGAVGRPGRYNVERAVVGQALRYLGGKVQHVDLGIGEADRAVEGQLGTVRRDRRIPHVAA